MDRKGKREVAHGGADERRTSVLVVAVKAAPNASRRARRVAWRTSEAVLAALPDADYLARILEGFWMQVHVDLAGKVREARPDETARWVLGLDASEGDDFAWWCAMADVEPDVLRAHFLATYPETFARLPVARSPQ